MRVTLKAIGSDGESNYPVNQPSQVDTEEIGFSYHGDTVVLTRHYGRIERDEDQGISYLYIEKYDNRNTLRYYENVDKNSSSSIERYDSCGRQVFRNFNSASILYIDSGRFVESRDRNWITHTYYGPAHRVDSEIVFANSRYRPDASVRNTFDDRNRLISKKSEDRVDSFFYNSNGTLSRHIQHQSDGLDEDETFDDHGNLIDKTNGEVHTYDNMGRPSKWVNTDYGDKTLEGTTITFEWGADNRPIDMKFFDKSGALYYEERCIYEF